MEDLGIEAKEAAVREAAKLLTLPEHLANIASIKSDYLSRQQVTIPDTTIPVRFVSLLVLRPRNFHERTRISVHIICLRGWDYWTR